MQRNCLYFTHQVEQICLYDGALIILRILQALQCGDSLTPDLRHLVLQPLQHSVVNLVVEFVVNAGVLSHILEQLIKELADSESCISPLHLVVVKQPSEETVEEQR